MSAHSRMNDWLRRQWAQMQADIANGCTCRWLDGAYRDTGSQEGCKVHDFRLDPRFQDQTQAVKP